ncbi:TetR family transcriptional regulator C-terminal domain-containing protein [Streptomyces sp. NBC_00654]|uniref:TetR/AcrR family transcriptional regulator n=1 Tax=Streptomyces sp. NBC_00654 TaxID=2975799 RepID=UPI002256CF7C|nr:TetR family transcriptional regulator C-terminal domain-containing protein [Streptomyces sp. NBC_00654]MCX4967836.1 TetR family transcriptional regulator C-terminal domain-containing protein [Streptomyces sp. NBC_00654]
MPARIDLEQRRADVIEAAFRLLVDEGFSGLSLRKVAAESGWNIGSVRHYFDDHRSLLMAAASEVGARMGRRLTRYPADALSGLTGESAVNALQELVEELLPIDEERRVESIVLTEFIVAARVNPIFRPVTEQMAADMRQVITDALGVLDVDEPAEEAERLIAVLGGLILDSVTPHGSIGVERLRRTLRAHLRSILVNSPGAAPTTH